MTVKQFIKSKSFKCILVLLCIALVSGALLAILNDVLAVSDEERVMRTIKKIYGKEIDYVEIKFAFEADYGRIDNMYKLADGNYLVKATGFDGYQQGTVSVWAVARFADGKYVGIDEVSIAGNEKQTLMSKFNAAFFDKFEGKGEEKFDFVVSGATFSSKAINNAVNVITAYFNAQKG